MCEVADFALRRCRRKPFVPPRLCYSGQMDCIVIQGWPGKSTHSFAGRGSTKTRTPGDWLTS